MHYMDLLYKDFYFNNPEIINPKMEVTLYDLETGEETVAVSYYREPNQFEQPQRIIDGKEVVYSTDVIGGLIPSNYEAIIAGYKLRGKYRKAAMLKRKYDKKLGVA